MQIKKVIAKNVYSFDKIDIDFSKYNVVQITGENLDEVKISNEENNVNGIGKTNLYNLIIQALYSRDISKTKKGYLKNMFVKGNFEIVLYVDDYKLVYTKDNTTLSKNGEVFISGRKAVTDFFEDRIPFDLFLYLSYISSSIYFPFFDATPKEQREFITLVFSDLLRLKEAIPKIKSKQTENNKEITQIKAKIEVYKEQVNQTIKEEEIHIPDLPELQDYTSKIKELEEKIRDAKITNQKIQELTKIKEPKKVEDKSEEINRLKERRIKGKTLIEIAEKEYKKITKFKGYSQCPTCGSKIEYDEELEKQKANEIQKLKKTMAQVTKEINELLEHQEQYQQYVKAKEQYDKAQLELTKLHEVDFAPFVQEAQKLRELDTCQRELYENTKKQREEAIKEQSKIEEQKKQKEKAQIELTQLENKLTKAEELKNKLALIIEICEKVIIEKQIPKRLEILEKLINIELSNFTSQYIIKLSMLKDKIAPKVVKNNKEYPYQNCSQGERGRINLALMLAIRQVLKVVGKSCPNFIFIDELLNIIDKSGKIIIVDILKNYPATSFIICHDFEFDVDQLILEKKDNKTCIKS